MSQVVDSLHAAREAAARHAWREAHEAFSSADRRELTPADLESFADAAWWQGKLDEAIKLREDAYAAFAAAGERNNAARLALTLSWDHSGRGAFSVSHGWFANAARLLEGQPESVEHGLMALTRAVNAMFAEGNYSDAITDFERAYELGQRFGDRDTQVLALSGKGRALIKMGDVEQGLALLDEATAAAVCGELRPYSTGLVYCITISSCQELGDYRRAAEWTEAANRWCDRLEVTGFPGACRIHRAEIMRLRGDLLGAEKQAVAACEELYDYERFITAAGYYEVGEIRRRLGDFAAAEEAYRTANELGHDPQPGLALLRLAEGKVDAALAGVTRALADLQDPLSRLRRLPAQVEIAIAAADLKAARAAAEELERIVDAYMIGGRRAPAFDATRLLETLGADKWKRLLGRHNELVRERIVESGGEVIKQTGDGFFASFGNPKAAIEAAVAIQRALDAELVAPDVRIGAHTGGAFQTDADARDYSGQGVHTAARIGAAAGAGEILVSRETLDGVGTAFRLSDVRTEVLKGFEQPVEVVSVDWR